MLETTDITLATNAIWSGSAAMVFLVACWLRRAKNLDRVGRFLVAAAKISSAAVWLHRTYWNLAIVMRPPDGSYSQAFVDMRHILAIPILATAFAALTALFILAPPGRRRPMVALGVAVVVAHVALWLIVERVLQ